MDSTQFHFTGFNGFGQFKNLSKVITSFQGIRLLLLLVAFLNGIFTQLKKIA